MFKLFIFLACLSSCQKKPTLSSSADPLSASEPPPMGATTYNDELKEELLLLDEVLDQKDPKKLQEIRTSLLEKKQGAASLENEKLAKVFLILPELIHQKDFTPNRKKWFKAKLFFIRRRFVEAASLMSEVIKAEPNFYEAINWQARAIFFLGNPSLAEKNLQNIILRAGEKTQEGLDALYLLGAISYESNDPDPKRIAQGIKSWERYMELALPSHAVKQEIENGLKELKQRLLGEKPATNVLDPFSEQPGYSAEKNSILKAFSKEELLLALELAEHQLKKGFDKDIATIKARILFKTGKIDEAMKLYQEITTKNKKYAPAFHYQGMAFMMKGSPKEAINSWQQVLKIDKAYGEAHNLEQKIGVAQKMVTP